MRPRVLLVDDEPNILLTLGLVLERAGFIVQRADSVQTAKRLLCDRRFDLLVTDLSLEQPLAGFDIVRLAKLQPIKPATVLISGFPDLLNAWKEHGADAALQKPTDVQVLLRTIKRLLRNHRRSAARKWADSLTLENQKLPSGGSMTAA
jgi:DNA-binding response OmpR family regulator